MSQSALVFDTTEQTFERDVLQRSFEVPVVVDFWAPWCGPCRTLGPILERLAEEMGGQFVLAKVNVDHCPQLAAAFQARSIPMVIGIRSGKVVAQFVGALPESAVREFLTRLLPSEAERLVARAGEALSSGRTEEAESLFRQALEKDPRCDGALLGLARIHAERGNSAEALALLDRIPPGSDVEQEAAHLAALLRVREGGPASVDSLRQRLDADPDDLDARFELAKALASQGRYEDALSHYLEIVRRDRSYRDDAARKAMVDIFEVLGPGNPTAEHYRDELARLLFA